MKTIPSATRIYIAFGNSFEYRQSIDVKDSCMPVSGILRLSKEVCWDYFNRFNGKQSDQSEPYTGLHRKGQEYDLADSEHWLDEAHRTGELFPEGPFVRPGLDFKEDGLDKNAKLCRKKYKNSGTHSPGIFTVQYLCRYSKLNGISVMLEMEVLITAFSSFLPSFKSLTRIYNYYIDCNMLKSVIIHVAWINNQCFIVCDYFITDHTDAVQCRTLIVMRYVQDMLLLG